MFVSIFGGGLNFAGVSWFVVAPPPALHRESQPAGHRRHPARLVFIPFIGGVLIDRFDRRYLGVALDLARGVTVLATAYVA